MFLLQLVMIIFFDLLFYTRLTALKKDTFLGRVIMYVGCITILAIYFVATYIFAYPPATSSFVCMSIPSFALFWLLSKYKDARFFVTFCFVDTVSLIFAFFGRLPGIYYGAVGAMFGCAILLIVFVTIYVKTQKYFSEYRELLESVNDGWFSVMVSTLLSYIILVFTAAYPKPLMLRQEYFSVYALLSLSVLSFYVVLITSLYQKKKLYQLNEQLSKEVRWHNMAYIDALTGLKNRMAYIERINALCRNINDNQAIFAVMLDIDEFKKINDTFGHHVGDDILKRAATLLLSVFDNECYEVFRVGGDEFAIIAIDVATGTLEQKLSMLDNTKNDLTCQFSYGYATVLNSENNVLENAFVRADSYMHTQKKGKKQTV